MRPGRGGPSGGGPERRRVFDFFGGGSIVFLGRHCVSFFGGLPNIRS